MAPAMAPKAAEPPMPFKAAIPVLPFAASSRPAFMEWYAPTAAPAIPAAFASFPKTPITLCIPGTAFPIDAKPAETNGIFKSNLPIAAPARTPKRVITSFIMPAMIPIDSASSIVAICTSRAFFALSLRASAVLSSKSFVRSDTVKLSFRPSCILRSASVTDIAPAVVLRNSSTDTSPKALTCSALMPRDSPIALISP